MSSFEPQIRAPQDVSAYYGRSTEVKQLNKKITHLREGIQRCKSQTKMLGRQIRILNPQEARLAQEIYQLEAKLLHRLGDLPEADDVPRPGALLDYQPKVEGVHFDEDGGVLEIDQRLYLEKGKHQFPLMIDYLKQCFEEGIYVRTLRFCPLYHEENVRGDRGVCMGPLKAFFHNTDLKSRLKTLELLPSRSKSDAAMSAAIASALGSAICSRKTPAHSPKLSVVKINDWRFNSVALVHLFGTTQSAPSTVVGSSRRGVERQPFCEKVTHFEFLNGGMDSEVFLGLLRSIFPGHGIKEFNEGLSSFKLFRMTGNSLGAVSDRELTCFVAHLKGCRELDLSNNELRTLEPIAKAMLHLQHNKQNAMKRLDLEGNQFRWDEVLKALPQLLTAGKQLRELRLCGQQQYCPDEQLTQIRRLMGAVGFMHGRIRVTAKSGPVDLRAERGPSLKQNVQLSFKSKSSSSSSSGQWQLNSDTDSDESEY